MSDDIDFSTLAKELEADLAQYNKGTGGNVVYLKKGRSRIKFLMPRDGDLSTDNPFYEAFEDKNKDGNTITNFLVAGVVLESEDDKAVDKEKIKYIKVPKTVLLDLIAKLSAGWDVFSSKGPVFDVKKLDAAPWYKIDAVMKGQKPAVFDASDLELPELSIEDAAKKESDKANNKQQEPAKPASAPANKRKVVLEEEDLPF